MAKGLDMHAGSIVNGKSSTDSPRNCLNNFNSPRNCSNHISFLLSPNCGLGCESNDGKPSTLDGPRRDIQSNEVVDSEMLHFTVVDMVGNSCPYEARSMRELRIKCAIKEGLWYPCVELFTPSFERRLKDSDDLSKICPNLSSPSSYVLCVIINEQALNTDICATLSGEDWINMLVAHVQCGGRAIAPSLAARAKFLDEKFEEKMVQWVDHVINNGNWHAKGKLRAKTSSNSTIRGGTPSAPSSSSPSFQFAPSPTAASKNPCEILEEQIKTASACGLDLGVPCKFGYTLLHRAALFGCPEILRVLIYDANIDVNRKDVDGSAALHLATIKGHAEVTRILLSAGANPSIPDAVGGTPVDHAAFYGYIELVQMLIKAGADVNARRNRGNTPLHSAALRRHVEVVRLLLSAGADRKLTNCFGETPFHYALNEECKRVLSDKVK